MTAGPVLLWAFNMGAILQGGDTTQDSVVVSRANVKKVFYYLIEGDT